LSVDGTVRQVVTSAGTVQILLQQEKIVVKGLDRCEPSLKTPLANGMVVAVTRVSCERFTRRTEIPTYTETRLDSRLYTTQTFEMQQGHSGLVRETMVVWKRDGAVSAQWVEKRKVVRRVQPTVILKGTLPETSRSGFAVRRVLTVTATAYDPGPGSCGPNCTGRTATGMIARKGVIAVDPRVIPLGTRVFVDGYGPAIAADTGGAIKGNRIDVCFPTRREALQWGRRRVQIMILQ
jgi:3D (Asp-Asp-Asp) domain-containing protein